MGTGCVIWPSDDGDDIVVVEPPVDDTYYTTVDADQLLDTDLGYGAGLFVEYGTGGRWTLWTSCDSELTGTLCFWDAHVYAHSGYISDLYEYETEDYDYVDYRGDNALTFHAETGSDRDTIEFYADPGAWVEIELVLDGYLSPEFFVWHGDGYVHDGATGSPVVFEPSAP
jgi:hypothetical protein